MYVLTELVYPVLWRNSVIHNFVKSTLAYLSGINSIFFFLQKQSKLNIKSEYRVEVLYKKLF